ncbi:MAG: hypothetical protein U0746_12090 [Gemmataceae bacterium]
MSTMPKPPTTGAEGDPNGGRGPRKIDVAFEEVARLSGSDKTPADFFQEFLARVVAGIDAPGGAIWLRTPQGFLQLQCQLNLDKMGLDKHKGGRQSHNELLRQAFQMGRPMMLEPYGTTGIQEGPPAGNPTEYVNLLAPIQMEKEISGIVEVWQESRWDARVQRTCLNYLVQMAGYASNYLRNLSGRKLVGQEQLWTQLEAFAREAHASLDPTRVAFHVANEGRRLIGCDRVSVAVVEAKKCKIEAVSGTDVIEKRSNLIQLMRALVDSTLKWGEKLVYQGTKDDSLPPDVLTALDEYLAESNSKLLVLQPLRDERQKDLPGPARSALLMEAFETPEAVEPLISRLDVVGRHAVTALYNAMEMRRVPLGWLWRPVAKVQEGLGGKTKAFITLGAVALAAILAALIILPYPLKLEANGQLLPIERQKVYPTHPGKIVKFLVEPNGTFESGQNLVYMYDSELESKLNLLRAEIFTAAQTERALEGQLSNVKDKTEELKLKGELTSARVKRIAKETEFNQNREVNNADLTNPGHFYLTAPKFSMNQAVAHKPQWTVLDADFRELLNKQVKASDAVLRLGDKVGAWELELKIPQKHIGQVRRAYKTNDPSEGLEVDLLLTSAPTRTFRGVLYRDKDNSYIAGEAVPNRDDHNESAPVVFGYVKLDDPSIPEDMRVPRDLMVAGVEVHSKIRCGNYRAGYSLFYGLWEFFYEKVVFFF